MIQPNEREYLRELARRYVNYASLPVMAERTKRWYDHNELRGDRPMVVMEIGTFADDLLGEPRCVSPLARRLERQLVAGVVNHELVDDDKVVRPYLVIPWQIDFRGFDLEIKTRHAADWQGRTIGFVREHPLTDLERDLPGLRHSVYSVDRAATLAMRDAAAEAVGDILPIRIECDALTWHAAPSAYAVQLMGMEAWLTAMASQPDLARQFHDFIRDDIAAYMDWIEAEGLLTLNNANQYAGAGSYGFSRELPRSESARTGGRVMLTDLWLNMNSQETVGISPAMYADLVFPAYESLARRGGLVYYGCCEPVHTIWDRCVSRLANLRKVSVSAWCDERFIGERLCGSGVIYSRKPSPNFIGVATTFDEDAFAEHMSATLRAARGCELEIIFRDIYTLCGERTRAGRAVKIVRRLIEEIWR